jgi:microcystin-dependent protein
MSDQFVGEIRIVAFNFPPFQWALCNGQILPITQNPALFSLLGTNFGGNGTSTFALPNFQGAVPIDQGQGAGISAYSVGETGGTTAVTLTTSEMPAHNHAPLLGTLAGGDFSTPVNTAAGNALAGTGTADYFSNRSSPSLVAMGPTTSFGGSQPHNNLMPYLTLNFVIALGGIFPSRS